MTDNGSLSPMLHAIGFLLDDRGVEAVVDDPALCTPLRQLFPAYARSYAGELPRGAERVVVQRAADGWTVRAADGRVARCPDFGQVITECEFALARALLHACADRVQLHASAAVVDGQAVLAAGASGSGKSSLAAAWAAAGHPVLGDDILFVDGESGVSPFKRLFKVATEVIVDLGLDPTATPFWTPGSTTVWYDPETGPGWSAPAPVALLAFPVYHPGAHTTIELLTPGESLALLLASVVDTGLGRHQCFETLARLAESVPGRRVIFGSVAAAGARLVHRH